ncbi:MAG: hypothetical protein WA081_03065 [Desulfosalsimonadaceae bacterium]
MTDKKKIAAIAAVTRYIQSEQEQVMACAPEASAFVESHDFPVSAWPPPAFNVWGAGGRAQQMNMRCLMQMKSFHRSKPMA